MTARDEPTVNDRSGTGERIIATFLSALTGLGVGRQEPSVPKVVLSDKARARAQQVFWNHPVYPLHESLEEALRAVAQIIVSDNLLVIARDADEAARGLTALGYLQDANTCADYAVLLRDHATQLNRGRPRPTS